MSASWPGYKESELIALGACVVCGERQLGNDVTFYLVTLERAAFDAGALERRAGLQMMLGKAGALAAVLGPDEELAKIFDGPHRVFVHESCAGRVRHLLFLIPRAEAE